MGDTDALFGCTVAAIGFVAAAILCYWIAIICLALIAGIVIAILLFINLAVDSIRKPAPILGKPSQALPAARPDVALLPLRASSLVPRRSGLVVSPDVQEVLRMTRHL